MKEYEWKTDCIESQDTQSLEASMRKSSKGVRVGVVRDRGGTPAVTEELWKPPGPSIKEEVKCQMLLMNQGK